MVETDSEGQFSSFRCVCVCFFLFLYGSTDLYGPGPPRFVEVSWSHTFETHHSQ
jgi:hypothetical protein